MPYDRFIVSLLSTSSRRRNTSLTPFHRYCPIQAIKLGPAANAMPTVWFSLAATIDGSITLSLLYLLLHQAHAYTHTREMLLQVVRLTLETVLLTHAIGATLFVLWLVSRTRSNMFWFLLEIIAETYSLSILFTLKSVVLRLPCGIMSCAKSYHALTSLAVPARSSGKPPAPTRSS